MPKVILISQFALPYSHIGSWTTMYKNYLTGSHEIDIIICPKPEYEFPGVEYCYIKRNPLSRIKNKFVQPYSEIMEPLKKVINRNEKYVIKIIDNTGLVVPLHNFLAKEHLRKNCSILFFLHGFAPFFRREGGHAFFEAVDELVLLTYRSYVAFRDHFISLPTKISVLHNGIDTQKFHRVTPDQKKILKNKFAIADKKVFVWCSQDRKKKGLSVLLDAWKQVFHPDRNIILLVIGCKPKAPQDGVIYVGQVPNDDLPEYFQAADVLLFPSLCHEGFPLTLTEALHCGCFCIASSLGGIPEVLNNGEFGKLIENPHFISEWVEAIQEYLAGKAVPADFPDSLYSTSKWNAEMNRLLVKVKGNLN